MRYFYKLKDYWDYFRMCLAAWIYSKSYEDGLRYHSVIADIEDVSGCFNNKVPEVDTACQWILGKDFDRSTKKVSPDLKLKLYPDYYKYQSLVHFRDILVNDYKRKLK